MRYACCLLFLVLLVATARPATAQRGWRAGLLLSGNASRLGGYDAGEMTEERAGFGYGAGLTVCYGLGPRLTARLDVRRARYDPRVWGNFRDEANIDLGDGYLHHRTERLTVPVLAQLLLAPHFYLVGGPSLSYVIRQRDVFFNDDGSEFRRLGYNDFTSQVRRITPGLQVGTGVTFAVGTRANLFAELTYATAAVQGFRAGFRSLDISVDPEQWYPPATPQNAWQHTLAFTAGFRFGAAAE